MSEQKHTSVPGFPGYTVDVYGNIFSVAHNWRGYGPRRLVQNLNDDGYPSVRLTVNGKRVHHAVYKLVALAFLPPRPSPAHEIRHRDGIKINSSVDNLSWGTRQDNADDREAHGRTSRGVAHATAIKRGLERRGFNVKW